MVDGSVASNRRIKVSLSANSHLYAISEPDMDPTWPRHEAIRDPIPPDVLYYSSGYTITKREKGSISWSLQYSEKEEYR